MNRAVACAIVLASSVASAGEHPTVQLEIDPCIVAPADEIRRVVAVELGALVDDGNDTNADRTHVTVACQDGAVALRVDDPITGKSLARTIELASTLPVARGRLVALAIVELVSASWTELELNPTPRVQPRGQRSSAAARDAALSAVLARTDQSMQLRSRLALATSGEKFLGERRCSAVPVCALHAIRSTRSAGWPTPASTTDRKRRRSGTCRPT